MRTRNLNIRSLAVFLFAGLLFISSRSSAQDLLDTLASLSCTCIKGINLDSLDKSELNTKLGVCVIQGAMPYKERLKAQQNIDLDELDEETGKRLGTLISMRMLTICPETLTRVGLKSNAKPANQKTGRIQSVEKEQFVSITLVDENRSISKYLWLQNFAGVNDLELLLKSKGKKVTINFDVMEFYDHRIKEYRNYYVITALKLDE